MSTPRTIIAVGVGARNEAEAAGVVTPGDLVTLDATGQHIRHNVASAKAEPRFAIENEIFGHGVYNNGVLHSYAVGDRVLAETMSPGHEVHATVAASAPAIAINDALESAGDGTLRKAAGETTAGIIARAREAVDNSGGSTKVHVRAVIV